MHRHAAISCALSTWISPASSGFLRRISACSAYASAWLFAEYWVAAGERSDTLTTCHGDSPTETAAGPLPPPLRLDTDNLLSAIAPPTHIVSRKDLGSFHLPPACATLRCT